MFVVVMHSLHVAREFRSMWLIISFDCLEQRYFDGNGTFGTNGTNGRLMETARHFQHDRQSIGDGPGVIMEHVGGFFQESDFYEILDFGDFAILTVSSDIQHYHTPHFSTYGIRRGFLRLM